VDSEDHILKLETTKRSKAERLDHARSWNKESEELGLRFAGSPSDLV
jgi:hypothetical protein